MFKFVPTSATGVRSTFGKFTRLNEPGLTIYVPFVQNVHLVSNKLIQTNFQFNVKTKDNIFSDVSVAIQHRVKPENTELAFYSLHNPNEQIKAYTGNSLRSIISKMMLTELFESLDTVSHEVSQSLSSRMEKCGYTIENALVTEISPDKTIQVALNHIEAAKRGKEAATEEAEAKYILQIREAEGERDRNILRGQGISGQRSAILKGYEESVGALATKFNIKPDEVAQFVLNIQHLEAIEKIGTSPNTKTIFVEHNLQDIKKQMLEAKE